MNGTAEEGASSADDSLRLAIEGGIATMTFNRPDKANYIDNDWLARMEAFFAAIRDDAAVRCVLIRSTGRYFMAGGDMNFHDAVLAMGPTERFGATIDIVERWNAMMEALLALPQPVVAAVQGGAIGASVGLVAAADIVVAAESAFFCIAHVHHGGAVDGLITHLLPRQIGVRRTLELALLGDRIGAAEAERIGLVGRVVADDRLEEECTRLVQRLARGPSRAYAMIKDQVRGSLDRSRREQTLIEALYTGQGALTRDWREGSMAVVEKRPAAFTGT